MKNLRKHFFYSDCHETPGGLKLWVAAAAMFGLLVLTGYLEGLDHAIYAPR
tara:strand:+ start:173 stop:325 length:153 start_codon:yes stop_codon:yes gene_type:complete